MVALQTREDEYLEVAQRYTREELTELGKAFGMLVEEMQDKPFLDCLGTYYTEIASRSTVDARGEFYTPPGVAEVMAQMSMDVNKVIEEGKPITVGEPACGSGGMVLALAKQFSPEVLEGDKSYVDLLRVTMQDISPTSADMAYVNTSLWGIPAKIILGDTLRMTVDKVWRNVHWARVGETANEKFRFMMESFKLVMETTDSPNAAPKNEESQPPQEPEDFSQMDFRF